MLHCSTTHTLARTRAYQYFCFLLSHLSQHSQQHTKNLIINTINLTSKWQTTHSAVTLLSHHPSSTTTPPHRAKFAVTLLSHYCHITITLLSHHYHRSHFFSKNQLLSSKNQCIPSKKSHIFPKKSHIFPRMSDIFSKKSLISSKKWDIIEESAHPGCAALWQMWQKKTQNSWYIRAHARERIRTPSASTASPNLLPHPSELNPQKHSSTKKHSSTMKQPTKNQQWNNQR